MLYIARYDQGLDPPSSLLPDEAARALQYLRSEDQGFFLFRRNERRKQLARLIGLTKRAPEICFEESGKPYCQGQPLHFSDSHREYHYFLAAGPARMGLDAEPVKEFLGWREIADRYFSSEEQQHMGTADDFFYIWTRKEALFKAMGCGINEEMSGYNVMGERLEAAGRSWSLSSYRWRNWLIAYCHEGEAEAKEGLLFNFSDPFKGIHEQGLLTRFTFELRNFTI